MKKCLQLKKNYDNIINGSLVKRLRRRPLTAETRVRFPYGLLKDFSKEKSFFFKKTLAIVKIVCYSNKRFVGQAVKTPPSHGGNTGSIPVRTAQGFLKREIFFF